MKIRVVMLMVLVSGCAPVRVSLRDIREYDQGIKLAESNGIDTTEQHKKLIEMIMAYLRAPGQDASDRAMQGMANAQTIQAIGSMPMFQPQPVSMPMSPRQYRNEVFGR